MTSNLPSILICLGVIVLMFAMFGVVIFVARAERQRKEKLAAELGFSPVKDEQKLLEHLAYVYPDERPERLRTLNVFQRQAGNGEIYMYSLLRHSTTRSRGTNGRRSTSTRSETIESNAFAFIAPVWHLPRLMIVPRWGGKGKFAELANRLGEAFLEIKANRIDFPHIPGVDEKYNIMTVEPDPLQISLPDTFLRTLAANPDLMLHTGGDTMTISFSKSITKPLDDDGMRQFYKLAKQLAKEIQG